MDFSERFSEIRRLRSFSYETLSEFSGISKTTIYKLEKKNSVPSLSTLSKLSSVLKCDLINLYRLSEQEYLAEFEQLRCKIESDFSMRDYSRLQEYIHELDGLYSSIVYKGGDIQKDIYFESLEKLMIGSNLLNTISATMT